MSHPKTWKLVGLQKLAPFLSCCELWYDTNRICYDFILREAWHQEILLSKMLKFKRSSMIMNTYQGHTTWYSNSNPSHMYLFEHWALSNCCDSHRDSCHAPMNKTHEHPQIKLLTLTLRVTQKHVFFRPPK